MAAESAERADKLREANRNSLTFPVWCSIPKIVRTYFAACGGEEALRKNERLRREPDNFKFLNDLSINHSSKFFKLIFLEKFSDLVANSLALLQKEIAPFGVFVIDEFRRGHGCDERTTTARGRRRVPLRPSAGCRQR